LPVGATGQQTEGRANVGGGGVRSISGEVCGSKIVGSDYEFFFFFFIRQPSAGSVIPRVRGNNRFLSCFGFVSL
jgi:hypothetical protein